MAFAKRDYTPEGGLSPAQLSRIFLYSDVRPFDVRPFKDPNIQPFATQRFTEQLNDLRFQANQKKEKYPVVGFGYSQDVGLGGRHNPILECFTTIKISESQMMSMIKKIGGEIPDIRITQTGSIRASARSAIGGDSIGSSSGMTGTLGCLVKEVGGGDPLLLSCNHVIADLNQGQLGNYEIWQPGAKDGGSKKSRIGVLYSYKNIDLGGQRGNDIDAALCKPDNPSDVQRGVRRLGQINGNNLYPRFNIPVRKYGWATKGTSGYLRMKNISVIIQYNNGRDVALFDNQYGIIGDYKEFSAQGDSGSIVLDEYNQAIGLIFSVATGIDLTYVNPISNIVDHFGINFI